MPSNWIIMEALTIWRKSKRKYVNEVPSNRIKDEVKACQGMKLLVSRRIFNWGGPGPTHLWPWKENPGKAFQIQIGLFLGGFICILLLDGGIISRSYSHRKARFHIQGQDNKAVVMDVPWRLHSFCQTPNKMLFKTFWKLVKSSPKTTTLLVLHTRNHDDKFVVICRSLLEVQTLSCQGTMHKEHKSSNYVRGRTATLRNCKYLCNQNHSDTIFSWYCSNMNTITVSW